MTSRRTLKARVKATMRGWVDRGAEVLGVLRALEARMRGGLTVLMYHRVLPDELCWDYPLASLAMPASAFREQVRLLAERYEAGPLSTGLAKVETAKATRPAVAITFDDGYADNYDVAAPILEEHGLRATFFVTTSFVGDGRRMWFDEVCRLLATTGEKAARASFPRQVPESVRGPAGWLAQWKKLGPHERDTAIDAWRGVGGESDGPTEAFGAMQPHELRALHERGHEIGSHTCSHPLLDQLPPEVLADELVESRRRIEEWIAAPVAGFCYPNGNHDAQVREAVRDAGYRWACATKRGYHQTGGDIFAIPRLDMNRTRMLGPRGTHDGPQFRAEVCRFHDLLRGKS